MRRRFATGFVVALAMVSPLYGEVAPGGAVDGVRGVQEARALARDGQYDEAFARARAAREAISAAHPGSRAVAYVDDDIASYLIALGRAAEAEVYARRAVVQIEKELGADTVEHALLSSTLATTLFVEGKIDTAAGIYRRCLDVLERLDGPTDRRIRIARSLARAYSEQARYTLAAEVLERALAQQSAPGPTPLLNHGTSATREKGLLGLELVHARLKANQLDAAAALLKELPEPAGDAPGYTFVYTTTAVEIQMARGEIGAAEQALETLVRTSGDTLDTDQRGTLDGLLGYVYVVSGQLSEAQTVYRALLDYIRTRVAADHPAVGRALHGLAITYQGMGRFQEAASLYERALAIFSATLGPDSAPVGRTSLEYSLALTRAGEPQRAAQLAADAITILENLEPPDPRAVGLATAARGFALKAAGDLDGASLAFFRADELVRSASGARSPDLPPGYIAQAEIRLQQGALADAEREIEKAISILDENRANTFEGLAKALAVRARVYDAQSRDVPALRDIERVLDIAGQRIDEIGGSSSIDEIGQATTLFETYLRIASEHRTPELESRMFLAAQYPSLSHTAATVTQVAARLKHRNDPLGELLESRQRLMTSEAVTQQRLERALAEDANATTMTSLRSELGRVNTELRKLNDDIRSGYPSFAEVAFPRPVTGSAVRDALRPGEGLLQTLSTPAGTYLFLVTAEGLVARTSGLKRSDVEAAVAEIRRSVQFGAAGDRPEFAVKAANDLYMALAAPVADQLKSLEHLVFVPEGAMTVLPPSLLVKTAPDDPKSEDYSKVEFLGANLDLSIAPSASAFVAMRRLASAAGERRTSFIGFGDPVLGLSVPAGEGGARSLVFPEADEVHASLSPLPESRIELTAMAAAIRAQSPPIYLGAQATEAKLKGIDLASYGIVVFATHGLLRDDQRGVAEPALVLSKDARNDGLLTSSEIAELKMDAEWVILSACNTAGTDGSAHGEGLSGLARSFFFAGARALLVSHWEVDSYATVLLTTGALEAYSSDASKGRARALRKSARRLMNGEMGTKYTHPIYWAPFVVVGEGGVHD